MEQIGSRCLSDLPRRTILLEGVPSDLRDRPVSVAQVRRAAELRRLAELPRSRPMKPFRMQPSLTLVATS